MEDLNWSSVFLIIISNSFMEEKCVCSIQIWKEVFDHFDRQPKKIEINENYSIDDDAKGNLAGEKQEDAGYRSKPTGNVAERSDLPK